MNTLSAETVRRLMRQNRKTIRGIAQEWNLTMKRVRQVRTQGVSGEHYVMDWLEILTGDPRYVACDATAPPRRPGHRALWRLGHGEEETVAD